MSKRVAKPPSRPSRSLEAGKKLSAISGSRTPDQPLDLAAGPFFPAAIGNAAAAWDRGSFAAAMPAVRALAPSGAHAPAPRSLRAQAAAVEPYPAPRDPARVPETTLAAERQKIERAIARARLPKDLAGRLLASTRAAIGLYTRRVADDSLPVGTSHLGGRPDLPAGTAWPCAGGIPMTFVAQFRLEEVAPFDADRRLPDAGLLSFFLHDALPDGADGPERYSACQVLFSPGAAGLSRAEPPEGFAVLPGRRLLATAAVRFHTAFELPSAGTAEAEEWGGRAVELDLPASLHLERPEAASQLLGYDDYQGYDAAPPAGTRPLFRCASDDQAAMSYGNAQDVSFRIADADLAAGHFERAAVWMQAG